MICFSYLVPFEDLAAETGIGVKIARKANFTRKAPPWVAYLKVCYRKQIESSASAITGLMP